jgi:hypothetical protein
MLAPAPLVARAAPAFPSKGEVTAKRPKGVRASAAARKPLEAILQVQRTSSFQSPLRDDSSPIEGGAR